MSKDDLKIILDYIKNVLRSRLLPLILAVIFLFSTLIYRLFILQIVNGESYKTNYAQRIEKNLVINSTRGRIYDCNGELLAYNELSYSIIFEDKGYDVKSDELNKIIVEVYRIIKENGDKYSIDYPIRINKYGKYEFTKTDNSLLRYLRDVYGKKYISELSNEERNSTPDDIINLLKSKKYYNISEEYSEEEVLEIIYVRSNLAANAYQKYLTFTVATNISDKTMAAILENADVLPVVTVTDEYRRCYNYGTYISHLIGYTGKVSSEELNELLLTDSSYRANDVVGKSGIEKSFESVLSGTKGSKRVLVDNRGRIKQVLEETEPITGSDIYLTIDVKLTAKIYDLLERRLAEILVSRIINSDKNREETMEGETVVIPIKDVYFALFDNNTLSPEQLENNTELPATNDVYEKYINKKAETLAYIEEDLINRATILNGLSVQEQDYLKTIRTILIDGSILNKDMISSKDPVQKQWSEGSINIKDYLFYAIANDWVNIYNLDVEDQYPSTEEAYEAILSYAFDELKDNDAFDKLIFKELIKNGVITGKEICMLLMEQEIIPYNPEEYKSIQDGASPYNFIIQQIKKLNITPAMLALDPCSGAVVLEDANTGNIISMVTYPSYDINNFSGVIDSNYYASLLADKSTPLVNRATQTRIAPGSTFKIATAIAGLMEGTVTATEKIEDTGIFDKVNPSLKCWIYPGNHGEIDVKQAIGYSCNYFFCEIGYRMSLDDNGNLNGQRGLDLLRDYAERLGLATKTGIQISEATPNASDTSVIASTIGQGTHAYTALNLARYTATIGNGGTVYNSSIISKIVDSNGDVIELITPVIANEIELDNYVWNAVYEGGRNVITSSAVGTELFDKYLPVKIGGKSGTAEENKNRGAHANYISWAPYNNADISVAVMIPNGYAAVNAGIMSFYTLASYYDSYIPSEIYTDLEGHITIVE